MPIKPKLGSYGDSFGKYQGNLITDGAPKGDIQTDKLNQSQLGGNVEFSPFEKPIRDFILASLGFPVVRVELTDFQIKIAIDEAITKLSYYAPLWSRQYATFVTTPKENLYELPQHIIQSLTYVGYKKTLLSIQQNNSTLEFDFFIKYFQDNFVFSNFAVGDFYLLQQSLEMTRKILGVDGMWEVVDNKYVQLYPAPLDVETVIVEYRGLNTETIHPYYRNWLQKYARAIAKVILGEIRGKFKSIPSPAGGAQLNGPELIMEGKKEQEDLVNELLSAIDEPPTFSTY